VKKFRTVLAATLARDPATFELRVSCHSEIDDRLLSAAHSGFLRRLRRKTGCEYFWINEWSIGCRHLHVLARADEEVPSRLVGEMWRKALPNRNLTYHAAPIRDQLLIATYLAKLEETPPEGFVGRLFSSSRGFLPKSVTELMRERTRPATPPP
jgi:hypothetical protein